MTESPPGPGEASEAFWRDYLINGDPRERALRGVLRRIPTGPRCKACAMPFGGVGERALRMIGKHRSDSNPNLCNACFDFMRTHRGGAEIEVTMLFADIRGSTTLGEAMSPSAFTALLQRFYNAATEAVYAHDGGIDKFVGDEVVAMFFPLGTGVRHAAQAVSAAQDLLRATGHLDPGGPWLPVGAGVHTGTAWVGAIGDANHVELTALGDAVNTAARLASVAAAGEILASSDTARAAGLSPDLPRALLDLKGKTHPTEVVRLGAGSQAPA
jgi:adenylate cyclase